MERKSPKGYSLTRRELLRGFVATVAFFYLDRLGDNGRVEFFPVGEKGENYPFEWWNSIVYQAYNEFVWTRKPSGLRPVANVNEMLSSGQVQDYPQFCWHQDGERRSSLSCGRRIVALKPLEPYYLRLSEIIAQKWGEATEQVCAAPPFYHGAVDYLNFAILVRYALKRTDLGRRLGMVGSEDITRGKEFPHDQREIFPLLTETGWESIRYNQILFLNLALPFAVGAIENWWGYTILMARVAEGRAIWDPFNAHIGRDAYRLAVGEDQLYFDFHPKREYPPSLRRVFPDAANGGWNPYNHEVPIDPVTDFYGLEERMLAIFVHFILSMRCYGPTNIERAQELSLFEDRGGYKVPNDLIRHYNPNPEWWRRFTRMYEGFLQLAEEYPEFAFIVNQNIIATNGTDISAPLRRLLRFFGLDCEMP